MVPSSPSTTPQPKAPAQNLGDRGGSNSKQIRSPEERTIGVNISLRLRELYRIDLAARAEGKTRSAWIRNAIKKQLEESLTALSLQQRGISKEKLTTTTTSSSEDAAYTNL